MIVINILKFMIYEQYEIIRITQTNKLQTNCKLAIKPQPYPKQPHPKTLLKHHEGNIARQKIVYLFIKRFLS